ncbi:MAG: LuxR C-terminal-related transcriptional regulator [Polyangiaceae bacterium]
MIELIRIVESGTWLRNRLDWRRVLPHPLADARVLRRAPALPQPSAGLDEELARQLEDAAVRAASRGGYAAEVSFMLEAASASPARGDQARRLLLAATAAFNAGSHDRAEALLEQARPNLEDPVLVTEAKRLDGRLSIGFADPRSAPARLLTAARELESLEPSLACGAYLEALEACSVSEHFTAVVSPEDVARAALEMLRAATDPPTLSDLLLRGVASLFLSDFSEAMPLLQRAVSIMRDEPMAPEDLARWFHLGIMITADLFDDESFDAWVTRIEQHARHFGAWMMLQVVLLGKGRHEVRTGQLTAAELTYDEAVEVAKLVGGPSEFFELLKADVFAWRGDESRTRAMAKPLREMGSAVGNAQAVNVADLAIAILELGSGRYPEALAAVEPLVANQQLGWTCLGLATAVEAAARTNQAERAARYLADLEERATAAGTDWALGQLARCRALVADDSDAEDLYLEAIVRLESTTIATELAQARLNYGEWLRRRNRQTEARVVLHAAHDAFDTMGAKSFAARARAELAATGDNISRRAQRPVMDLTPQGAQAARLAATGATNAEIATRTFISANTVDYHLRKVYRKLGITSRRELAGTLAVLASPGSEADRRGSG